MAEDGSQRYEKIDFLGEGQFATVYKARDLKTGEIVAIKKIKIGSRAEASDGIHRTAIREIKILQEIKHKNIIGLQNVFGYKSNISLVFDFMETDLEVIIRDTKIILSQGNVKAYTIMTLQGVEYLHKNWILHRDLKPNNLLINSEGVLKIGDFGLAKQFGSPSRPYTHNVVTRWYRCPELLFGARWYSTGVDMWAVGCILAELLIRAPLFQGETDLDQLSKIFQVTGTPTADNWPLVEALPDYIEFHAQEKTPLKSIFCACNNDVIEVLEKMLTLNPLGRCDASQALQMPYFSNKPGPTPCANLPRPSSNKIVPEMELKAGSKRKLQGETGLAKKLIF